MLKELTWVEMKRALGLRYAGRAGNKYVYLARAEDGSVKIGLSWNPDVLVRGLRCIYGLRHNLLVTVDHCLRRHEMAMHSLLRHERTAVSREHFKGPDTELVVSKLLAVKRIGSPHPETAAWYLSHLLQCDLAPGGMSETELKRMG